MITIKKLRTLKSGTLRRKIAIILQSFENDITANRPVDINYMIPFFETAAGAFADVPYIAGNASKLQNEVRNMEPEVLLRSINSLRHLVLAELGAEPADWDLSTSRSPVVSRPWPESGRGSGGAVLEVFLDDLRSPFNIGSIFRTSEAFGVSGLMLSPDCPDPNHPRARRSSMGCTGLISWSRMEGQELFCSDSVLSGKKILFALELGGTPVSEFKFPENGIAIIGSEELGISPGARAAALKSGGLVSIPVYGKKGSINVSVAFGIMIQRWSEQFF